MVRKTLLIVTAVLALTFLACAQSKSNRSITDMQSLTDAANSPQSALETLKADLQEANKGHYTIGCVYDSPEAQQKDNWADRPPIPPPAGRRSWSIASEGYKRIALYDPESGPTNAASFQEVREGERTCLTPE